MQPEVVWSSGLRPISGGSGGRGKGQQCGPSGHSLQPQPKPSRTRRERPEDGRPSFAAYRMNDEERRKQTLNVTLWIWFSVLSCCAAPTRSGRSSLAQHENTAD